MLSGMVTALSPSSSASNIPKNPDLREHVQRLTIRLTDPYLRALLMHLTVDNDFAEVLQEDALPLLERLAIALQFLSDKELSSYVRRMMERCVTRGDVEGLVFSGLAGGNGGESVAVDLPKQIYEQWSICVSALPRRPRVDLAQRPAVQYAGRQGASKETI